MQILALLLLSLAVATGLPLSPPDVAQNSVLPKEEQGPLLGDVVPVQGHVKVENPAPQPELSPKEQLQGMAAAGKVEELKEQPEVKVEELKEKTEVKVEELKEKPEVKVEELKEKPEVKVEELKEKPEVKVEELKEQPEVKVEELKVKPEVKVEELKEQPEVKEELKVESEVPVEPEVELASEVLPELNPEDESEAELVEDPDLKGESEVQVEADVETEPEPEDALNFQVQMTLEEESDPGNEDMPEETEGEYEMVGEEAMELEPEDDDGMIAEEPSNAELAEAEKNMRVAFLGPDAEVLPEQSEVPLQMAGYVSEVDPVMEMELEDNEDASLDQYNAIEFDEGPALDIFGQPISLSEDYFPDEEANMGMRAGALNDYPAADEFAVQMLEDPVMEEHHELDEGAQIGVVPERKRRSVMSEEETGDLQKQGKCCCPGVLYEGKCYQFFNEPKRAADAEWFCQGKFPGGHLASITSQHIHRAVMNDMVNKIGSLKRTWVGGLRFLDTGRFIWMDGAHWGYADWLHGEPNNTSDLEDCIELLPNGNGKFNDFTCWEPQTFICSYPF